MPNVRDAELRNALRLWRAARAARTRARDRHDWANAETAVRFWAGEFRSLRADLRTD